MSGRDELVERIARALAPHMEGGREFDQMPKDKATLKAWHRANMCSINDATQEDALAAAGDFLPIINAEIAAERERCALIVDAAGRAAGEHEQWETSPCPFADARDAIRSQP